ncbi:MAG: segregation/condensation protein A [Clostridia bacterium]|nr:segregation/condensation protein A [Clostridia bacterium]MBR3552341.1 segregation/condensation protein A [Clostridia bacterium]
MEKLQYKLEVFEGPLDLLLHLIAKHKLNIYDIPIFELVEQYVDYVRRMEEADMEIASEFVEMAARLIYIKTVSLLPVYDEAKQLKEELTGELLDYQECKALAQKLAQHTEGFDRFVREPVKLPADRTYRRLHEAADLLAAYLSAVGKGQRKLPPPMEAFTSIVSKKVVSVNERIVFIYRKLLKERTLRFGAFFDHSASRSQMVATFLAMLELVKANRITLDDDNAFVTLQRRKRGEP